MAAAKCMTWGESAVTALQSPTDEWQLGFAFHVCLWHPHKPFNPNSCADYIEFKVTSNFPSMRTFQKYFLGHQFSAFCESLKMIGRSTIELYRFVWRHCIPISVEKCSNVWKLVETEFWRKFQMPNAKPRTMTISTELLNQIIMVCLFYLKFPTNGFMEKLLRNPKFGEVSKNRSHVRELGMG